MRNSKGSALAIALSSMALFSMLGIGAIEYSTMQRQVSVSDQRSTQAFWLADGGIQKAVFSLQSGVTLTDPSLNGTNNNFGVGSYAIKTTSSNPYTVIATGNVVSTLRTIKAVIENFNGIAHDAAAVYSSDIDKEKAISAGSGATQLSNAAVNDPTLTAQKVFGTSLSSVEALATMTHINGDGWAGGPVSGITVFKTRATDVTVYLTDVTSSSGALLIIDTSASTSEVTVHFQSSSHTRAVFQGIIYDTGSLYEDKYVDINGAVYVQGALLDNHDNGGGNSGLITGNSTDISQAGALFNGHLFISSWQECTNSTCT